MRRTEAIREARTVSAGTRVSLIADIKTELFRVGSADPDLLDTEVVIAYYYNGILQLS